MNKKLNLFDLISIGVGAIIGAGVFSMMGYGIAYTGRSITLALMAAMLMVVLQSIRFPILASVFDVEGGAYGLSSVTNPLVVAGLDATSDMFFKIGSGSVTTLALAEYFIVLFPALAPYKTITAVILLTLAYVAVGIGDKFTARIQNIMAVLMYVALGLFIVFGIMNYTPAAYEGEPMFVGGISGFLMAAGLMSYTCNGFQYVISMYKAAENPKRDIPLGFYLSALIGVLFYVLIGFSATHSTSYGDIAGLNLGDISKMMMPNGLYLFFIIGGAIFALGTSLVGGTASAYRPVQAACRDGWFPKILGEESKKGFPYILIVLYLMSLIPIIFNIDVDDVATMSLIPMGIIAIISNMFAMNVPTQFSKEWKESGHKMSATMYKVLLWIGNIASVVLVLFCFLSNDLKIPTTIITVAIMVYAVIRSKSDKIKIRAKDTYSSEQ